MSLSSDLMVAVFTLISALEANTGQKIAILDRVEDPQMFWARSAAILCQKTGDSFCDKDMQFMKSNTEPSGMSQLIEYKGKNGQVKRVCAVLPPINKIDASYLADAMGTGRPKPQDVAPDADTQAWITLYHAAHCLDTNGSDFEEKRAAAFATLGLVIIDADPSFTAGMRRSPPRQLAVISGQESAYWAAGVGERLVMDLWKREAADRLRDDFSCDATVVPNTSIDMERTPKHSQLTPGQACEAGPQQDGTGQEAQAYVPGKGVTFSSATAKGTVSDENLWVWMYGTGGLGVPPKPWRPWKMFGSAEEAADYALKTAESLAKQK